MSSANAQHTKTALVNGARIAYIERGQGPALLFVHGLGASKADFDKQVDYFSRIFRVIAPDLRGHGSSDAIAPYSIERFATDMLALMEQLSPGNFAVVGHSMGGAVAMQMALYKPERIYKLVLADTLPSFVPNSFQKRAMVWGRILMMHLFGPKALSKRVAANMFPNKDQEPLRKLVAERNGNTRKSVYLSLIGTLTKWSVSDKLLWMTMPTLVLAGEHDYFQPSEAEVFAENLPNGKCRIFSASHHHLPLERPDEFNRNVMEFLIPGASVSTLRGDGNLDWLKVDTLAVPKIDVKALMPKSM